MRRRLLVQVPMLLAPRLENVAYAKEPLIIAGVFSSASGLGASARLCYKVLHAAGLEVKALDLTHLLKGDFDYDTRDIQFTKPLPSSGTVIFHVNPFLLPYVFWQLGRNFIKGKKSIGYFAWELPEVPLEWRFGMNYVDEIWVTSQFTAQALKPIAQDKNITVLAHPVACEQKNVPATLVEPNDKTQDTFRVFLAFNMLSSYARKNPIASIKAFQQAFADDPKVHLTVKCINGKAFPQGLSDIVKNIGNAKNITLIDKALSDEDMTVLLHQSDVVMSLHRSEGFGLVPASAMLAGKPVIATNYSGNCDFLNETNGIPVPYTLVKAQDPQGEYDHPHTLWAEADIDFAAQALQRLRSDASLRKRLGDKARQDALNLFSAERYVKTVSNRLQLSLSRNKQSEKSLKSAPPYDHATA